MIVIRKLILRWRFWLLLGVWALPALAAGEEPPLTGNGRRFLLGIEYLHPTEEDRNIRTVNLDGFIRLPQGPFVNFSVYVGLTLTHATGDITQLEGDLQQGTLREVNYASRATGIGPGVLADWRLIHRRRLSLHLAGCSNLMLYDRDFPAGGDRYNFMWRGGPWLKFHLTDAHEIGLAWRWMHLSNGQGPGPQNPSYDAQGLSITYALRF